MPRKPTPRVEVELPPDEECPDGSGNCARDVTDEALDTVFGHHNFSQLTTIISPVIVRKLDNSGHVLDEWTFPSSDWECLETFLDHLRHRLGDIVPPELVEKYESLMARFEQYKRRSREIGKHYRATTKELDLLRSEQVVAPRLRDIVVLERRARARGELAQLAGIRLHRWSHPIIAGIVKQAREALR